MPISSHGHFVQLAAVSLRPGSEQPQKKIAGIIVVDDHTEIMQKMQTLVPRTIRTVHIARVPKTKRWNAFELGTHRL